MPSTTMTSRAATINKISKTVRRRATIFSLARRTIYFVLDINYFLDYLCKAVGGELESLVSRLVQPSFLKIHPIEASLSRSQHAAGEFFVLFV
jgi:hypothetical protein